MKHILIIFFIALTLRVGFSILVNKTETVGDEVEYDTIGYNLASGHGFSIEPGNPTPIRAPLYPAMLSVVYLIAGHSITAAVLIQSVLGALTCVCVFILSRHLFGIRIAFLAGLLSALYPVTIAYGATLLSETLFTFLFVLSILLIFFSFNSISLPFSFAAGITLGLATLTRPTTILFPFAIALALLLAGHVNLYALKKWMMMCCGFLIIIAVWMGRNYHAFDAFLPVSTGEAIGVYVTGKMIGGTTWEEGLSEVLTKRNALWEQYAHEGGYRYIHADRELKTEGMKKIRHHIALYSLLLLRRFPQFWCSSHSSMFGIDLPLSEYLAQGAWGKIMARLGLLLFHLVLLCVALAGMAAILKTWRQWALLPITFAYFSLHILFDPCNRFTVPVMPLMFIFDAVILVVIYDKIRLRTTA